MASEDLITHWNRRYGDEAYLFGTEPTRFLERHAHLLRPGSRVLAVADGEGRNGVWLASRGLDVLSVDGSSVALAKARHLAAGQGVTMTFECADLMRWDWPQRAFDAVVALFIQFADPPSRDFLFERMKAALVPGGLLLLHGYRPEQVDLGTGGPPHRANMYTEDMLRRAFADLAIERCAGYDDVIHEGTGHDGPSALIDLVAWRRAG